METIESIITTEEQIVNFQAQPAILTIKAFDEKGVWFIEVKFSGGATAITRAELDEVTQIEADLNERDWQVDPSLFCAGFNAKPKNGLGRWWAMRADAVVIAEDEPLQFSDEDELIFASSADMWPDPDNYSLEPAL